MRLDINCAIFDAAARVSMQHVHVSATYSRDLSYTERYNADQPDPPATGYDKFTVESNFTVDASAEYTFDRRDFEFRFDLQNPAYDPSDLTSGDWWVTRMMRPGGQAGSDVIAGCLRSLGWWARFNGTLDEDGNPVADSMMTGFIDQLGRNSTLFRATDPLLDLLSPSCGHCNTHIAITPSVMHASISPGQPVDGFVADTAEDAAITAYLQIINPFGVAHPPRYVMQADIVRPSGVQLTNLLISPGHGRWDYWHVPAADEIYGSYGELPETGVEGRLYKTTDDGSVYEWRSTTDGEHAYYVLILGSGADGEIDRETWLKDGGDADLGGEIGIISGVELKDVGDIDNPEGNYQRKINGQSESGSISIDCY